MKQAIDEGYSFVLKAFFFILFALVTIPLLTLAIKAVGTPADDVWNHIKDHSLSSLIPNTLLPVIGVGMGSCVLGVLCAFLTVFCPFPGRAVFDKLFILPLALPLYIISFVYRGLFEYSGPFFTWPRVQWGLHLDDYFSIQSLPAICLVFSLALYPYVYLMAKEAFSFTGIPVLRQATSLGIPLKTAIIRLLFPSCFPWISGGILLAMMETLADFGGFAALGHDTLTTAIYTSWFGLFSFTAACKISLFLLGISFFLIFLSRKIKPRRLLETTHIPSLALPLTKWGKCFSFFIATGIVFFSLLLPLSQLFIWAWTQQNLFSLWPFLINSLLFSLGAALCIIPWSLFWSYLKRNHQKLKGLIHLSLTGYALPGVLIAMAVFSPYQGLGVHWGTLMILFLAYATRFLPVAFNPLHSACEQIPLSLDKTALSLGKTRFSLFLKIHLPLMKKSMGGAFLLIFMEIFKEMPITVFIRPFNMDTLAVKVFELTSEGEWEMAAPPSLLLVFFSMIIILLMTKDTHESHFGTHRSHPPI